jgi:hypothetical protein
MVFCLEYRLSENNWIRAIAGTILIFVKSSSLLGAEQITIPLGSQKAFHHITFENIPPTTYHFSEGILTATVKESASFLLYPFPRTLNVSEVVLDWKCTIVTPLSGSETIERSKEGDDFCLRVGLVLAGPAPLIPFFAPSWIKATRDLVHESASEMYYLVAGSRAAAGAKWVSPYASSITNIALSATPLADGWVRSVWQGAQQKVVALWLMSDGDNTNATFSTTLRSLALRN